MNFPDFSTWHKVPKDATIQAGTPFWRYDPEEYAGRYFGQGVDYAIGRGGRWPDVDYYTEQPIPDPDEAANWKKAEKMYRTAYSSLDDAWEYQSQDTKDRWYTLAKKYDEKEN